VGEVAGPHGRAALAEADIDADLDRLAPEVRGDGGFVIALDRIAIGATAMPPKRIESRSRSAGFAGLADRHDDAAPVGVLAGDGGLDQRRIGDGQADAARAFVRGGAGRPGFR
jgi:hypothetical protein